MLTIKIGLHLLHKVCGNQAANANLTFKNSARNQDRAYFLLYTTLIYANLRTTVEKNKITRLKRWEPTDRTTEGISRKSSGRVSGLFIQIG
jgi:hypothetical protein